MASTPEKRVKDKVVKILKERSGVPDIVCCFNGNFFAVECKAGKNKPTTLQEREMEAIRNTGGTALVVNEENIDHVRLLIEEML
jgi:Holliday junction resolvase